MSSTYWLDALEKSLDNASKNLRKGNDEGLLSDLALASRYVRRVKADSPSLRKSQLLRRFVAMSTLEGTPLRKGLTGSVGSKMLTKPEAGMGAMTKKKAVVKKAATKTKSQHVKLYVSAGKLSTGGESSGSKLKSGNPSKLSGMKKSLSKGDYGVKIPYKDPDSNKMSGKSWPKDAPPKSKKLPPAKGLFGSAAPGTGKTTKSLSFSAYMQDLRKSGKAETAPSLKPPKGWWDKMTGKVKAASPHYSDQQVRGTVGKIWYKTMSGKKRATMRKAAGGKYGKAPTA